jgi:copper chaperone CopZ
MKTFQTELPSMFGDHHVREVRRILLDLPGVDDIYASSSFQFLELQYDDSKVKEDQIKAALEQAGYLGEVTLPREADKAGSETGEKSNFRHTAAFNQTRQVSFHHETAFSGRPLYPCPGMSPVTKEEMED